MDVGSFELRGGDLRAVLDPKHPSLEVWVRGQRAFGPLAPAPPAAFEGLLGQGARALSRGEVRGRAGPAQRLEWLTWSRSGLGLRWCIDVCDAGSGIAFQLTLENRSHQGLDLAWLCPLSGPARVSHAETRTLWRGDAPQAREGLALAEGPHRSILVAGFVTGRRGFGVGRLGPAQVRCDSWIGARRLEPGTSLESDRAWLGVAPSRDLGLDGWARRAGLEMESRAPGRPALVGGAAAGLPPTALVEVEAEDGIEPEAWRQRLAARRDALDPGALLSSRGPLLASAGLADALRLETPDALALGFASQRLGLLDLDLTNAGAPGLAPVLAGLIGGVVHASPGEDPEAQRRSLPPLAREARVVAPGTLCVLLRGERVAVVWYDPDEPARPLGASLASLGLGAPAHGYDFFANEDLGLLTTEVPPRRVPGGLRLVALTPPAPRAQVVGSNLHVGMGTAEVAALRADGDSLVLVLRHAGPHEGDVWVARPGRSRAERVPVQFSDRAELPVPPV